MNDGRSWAGAYAFRNWRGLGCPACGEAIPALRNWWSQIILWLSAPLWVLPWIFIYRGQPLRRPTGITPSPETPPERIWWLMAAAFGATMWLIMSLAPSLWRLWRTGTFDWASPLFGAVIWLIGGLAFGIFMRIFLLRRSGAEPSGSPSQPPAIVNAGKRVGMLLGGIYLMALPMAFKVVMGAPEATIAAGLIICSMPAMILTAVLAPFASFFLWFRRRKRFGGVVAGLIFAGVIEGLMTLLTFTIP